MRIVLTGAAGFIGSHTCEALVGRGHDVVGIDSFDGYLYDAAIKHRNVEELARLPPARFRLVEADITDPVAMRAVIEPGVDVVCHLAALAGVRPSLAEPARYMRTNVEGTCVVLEAMRAAGCDRIAFVSSSSVYGIRTSADLRAIAGFREDEPCDRPASPYAATKRMGELLCSTYRDLHGIGTSCLRYFTVYGPRQRPDMAIRHFAESIDRGEVIQLFGDGESRRDYTFISDIVAGTVAALETLVANTFSIYNLGGTESVSLSDLVATIEAVVGKRALIERRPDQPGDVPVTHADLTRARTDLGYSPQVTLREGIERFWAWYQRAASG